MNYLPVAHRGRTIKLTDMPAPDPIPSMTPPGMFGAALCSAMPKNSGGTKMNIVISYIWDEDFDGVVELTLPRVQAYAAIHGYELIIRRFLRKELVRNVQWQRVLEIQELLGKLWWESLPDGVPDAVFHCDADVLITNPEIELEFFISEAPWDIAMSREPTGAWNDGTCLFNNTQRTKDFLQFAWNMENRTDVTSLNGAVQKLYDEGTLPDHITLVEIPKRQFNSYPSDWKSGDFVLHCPGMSNEARIETFKHVLETGRL